jgi:selenocysteine lyase/cysteine desulfurase
VSELGTDWKAQFSDFGGRAYLDCAAQGPFPRDTAAEVRRALRYKEHPEEIPENLSEDLSERARTAVARLIGCHPSSIALGTGTSHGTNLAARGLPIAKGDEVLMAQGEFPALVYPFLNREREGIKIRFVHPSAGSRVVPAERIIEAIEPATKVIATSLVQFATGYRTDLQALGDVCRERKLFLVVDGAQGVGGIDFRVGDFPIDILAVSGFKWLLGPYGSGFTYVNPRILEKVRVTEINWRRMEGAIHPGRRSEYHMRHAEGARRFDVPEVGSHLHASAFAASVEFLNRVRVPTVEGHVGRLFDRLIRGIETTPLSIVSDLSPKRRSCIMALQGPNVDATRRIFRSEREAGVIVSLRENLIRVSPNLYNGPADIDRFLAVAASIPVD